MLEMKKAKLKKDELKLEENKKKPIIKKKKVQTVISFDVYFQRLIQTRDDIMSHHKAPMRLFASKNGKESGTLEDFEKLFSLY